jgi:ribosomal protein S18 acetylase RimI-like enzyme
MLENYTVKRLDSIDDDLREELETALDVDNARVLPQCFDDFRGGAKDRRPLDIYLSDADENLVGGLVGVTYWNALYIDMLWVAREVRKQGIGRALMHDAETEAIARDCRFGWLRTFSFQARGFYERLGYRVIGQLDDHPPGHTYYFMRKDFTP